ncbi:helix-turn-helix domain-containing protein [Saccharopolyspora hattusasensis]|uniref:helix-turn-helix domain-containing protein n=1 Tax=Saccharopolyspora hattusasensis TaxID=1128679 RepID=UPI003D9777A8
MAGVNEGHTPKARLLGAELRELRNHAGMTVRDLADALGVGQATVSRYERGERTPAPEYVARVLGTLGVTGDKYDELVEFAATASEPNMIADSSKGIHRHLIELSEFDRAATRILHVAPLLVPGPLQIREYAREVMTSLPPHERDVRVELRMARKEAIAEPRQIEVIIAERALRDALGGADVMSEQLRHLANVATRPNITIRVIPADLGRWTLAHNGAFVLYEFAKAPPIVHLEHYRGPAFLRGAKDVESYREAVDTLREAAISEGQSTELMAAIVKDLERNQTP